MIKWRMTDSIAASVIESGSAKRVDPYEYEPTLTLDFQYPV